MKRKLKKHLGDYQDYLIGSLKEVKEAKAYLNAALEEDDPESFLVALRNVIQSQGVSKTAKLSGLNRVSLYKMLSRKGNPSMTSLYAVLRSIGLVLRIEKAF